MRCADPDGTRGATIVEFALVLPFFLALVFATIDFGRISAYYIVLSDALREAGRFGATRRGDCTGEARAFFRDRLSSFGMDPGATMTGRTVTLVGGGRALELDTRAVLPCVLCSPLFTPVFHEAAVFPLETADACSDEEDG